ncbi:Ribosomal large subunit pseudouridine synthase D [Porphyromonas cangingivalis]|uniref:RluA family pseudouridine synthase n=1 Tax=Porphyromonas cangingivalis TaxID=36874 RepID=UPI000D865F34|nr:pseudouridine synthase [Porphyromonas cangingivalis]SPY35198.1 Ribosomal large subunit pseudouridine synthase D [Porphyromonas cangingivalis]
MAFSQNKKSGIRHENPSPIKETYVAKSEGVVLIDEIQTKSGRTRTAAKRLISSRRVSVNGKISNMPTTTLSVGSLITVHSVAPPKEFTHPLIAKVWENDDCVLVRKEAGISTVNTAHKDRETTAIWVLSQHYKQSDPDAKLFMINRLDKETAGFVLFAKSVEAKETLVKQWSRLVSQQKFVAVVTGEVDANKMTLVAQSKDPKEKEGSMALRNRIRKVMQGEVNVLKSSENKEMHVVEIILGGERIFSLRKLLGDNGLVILGDGRYRSDFVLKGKIALEQVLLQLTLPGGHRQMTFERTYPTHFFTYLKKDKSLLTSLRKKQI